jgi:hypothetical protein
MKYAFAILSCLAALPLAAQEKTFTVPFETLGSQHMAIMVKINGKGPYRMIFDTGAPFTLLGNKAAREAEVFPKNFKPSIFTLLTNQVQFKMKNVEIGPLKLDNVDCVTMDHPTVNLIAKYENTELEGIVGFNVFGRYRMTIDYQKKQMTFTPNGYEPQNMFKQLTAMLSTGGAELMRQRVLAPGGLLGVRVQKEAGDRAAGVSIEEVYANSPAQRAGLKSGDRLLTLDDRWTDSVADCFDAATRVKPGENVRLEVLRDGKKLELYATFAAGQ